VSPSRWPVRVRLTALYAGAFLAGAAVLVAATYWLVARTLRRHDGPTVSHPASDGPRAGSLQQAIDTYRSDTLDRLLTWSIVALVGALVLAIALGWVLASRALRPLHHVTETANRVAERSLHERISLAGPDDEVKELADTIDAMLERLDRSFDAQRRFVANASHELRTPLAVNRTMLEVALGDPDLSDDVKRFGPKLLATNERSERMVEGLLILARSEQGVSGLATVDLARVASVAVEQEHTEAQRRKVTVTTELRRAPVSGCPMLIERLAANLIQNAVRHSPTGAEAIVRTGQRNAHSVLTVENPGVVLRPDEIDQLFEPFRRGNGRTSSDGIGLGLSIVRSVTQAHGGTVTARPRTDGGLVVEVELPAAGSRTYSPPEFSRREASPSRGSRLAP
jgi:signal transduction histidine kinase